MGSPLGPIFGNIFLSFHKRTWLADCPHTFKPMFYRRHVDYCFLIFRSKEQVIPFLDYLNSKHPNIQCPQELENDGSLSFLDITITRTNGCFSTSVFHKPSSTGLFTNFNSFISITYQKGLLLSLILRYFNICSCYRSFHCELQNFKHIFSLSGYPASLIDNCIRTFVDKIFSPKPPVHSCFAFHTLANMVYKYAHNFTNYFLKLTRIFLFALSFVLRARCLICSIQGPIPFAMRSHVVYKYKCQCCGALYVGQTRRTETYT